MALAEAARYAYAMKAEIACGFLESHGVGAVVFDTGLNGVIGIPSMFPARLMVLDEDLTEARALLAQADLE